MVTRLRLALVAVALAATLPTTAYAADSDPYAAYGGCVATGSGMRYCGTLLPVPTSVDPASALYGVVSVAPDAPVCVVPTGKGVCTPDGSLYLAPDGSLHFR